MSDYGSAALRIIAEALPHNNHLIILAGYPSSLQVIIANNALGLTYNFFFQIEYPNITSMGIARLLIKDQFEGCLPKV